MNNIINIPAKEKTTVLIIGKGYIGNNLTPFLAFDDNLEVHNIERSQINYLNSEELVNFFESYKNQNVIFDYIINAVGFTGKTNIDDALDNKELCYILNTVFPISLSNISRQVNPSCKLINISSGCIYDGYKPDSKGWGENDVPNFGICDDASSFYSKTKHASELILSSTCDNVYNLRIRMPFSEVPSNRNLLQKLFKYTTLLNASNSITYLYDLFNVIYNLIVSDSIPYGVYNVVSDGIFNMEMFIEAVKENEDKLIKSGFISKTYLKDVKLIDLDQFTKTDITKENRSSTTLDNTVIKTITGAQFVEINKELISSIIKDLIRLVNE